MENLGCTAEINTTRYLNYNKKSGLQITNPVVAVQSLSHVQLFCNSMDCSPPGFSIPKIFQARILEWVPFPSPGDLPDPGTEPASPALAGFFTTEPPGKPQQTL